ncbi:hypothetical protein [Epibacterium ulvae]|uniref:hypothetical protein n=1 Tax=Epibacterium ulvae TaxID=1156985 RepID=UPI002490B03F|nr:hypothetical protein [Epibacterium ulvae]
MTMSLDVQTPAKRVGDLIQLAQHYAKVVDAQSAAFQAVRAAEQAFVHATGAGVLSAATLGQDVFREELERTTEAVGTAEYQISELVLELLKDGSLADFHELLNAQISGRP